MRRLRLVYGDITILHTLSRKGCAACVPGMAHTLGVEVPGAPGSGKRVADGKGVRREAESEGSRRRNLGPRNTNRIRRARRVRPLRRPKPHSCTESANVNAAGIEGKGVGLTPGGLTGGKGAKRGRPTPGQGQRRTRSPVATANREESAEAIVPVPARGEGPNPDGGSH